MKVKDAQFFTVVSSFLNVYLVKNRSCSSNTVKSYEDALNLLFTFWKAQRYSQTTSKLEPFTRQNIQEFVDWLEKVRNCSRQTQLQRLAAIRSFVRYGGHCRSARNCNTGRRGENSIPKTTACFGWLSHKRRTFYFPRAAELQKAYRIPEYGVSGFNVRYSCSVSGNVGFKDTGFSAAQNLTVCLFHR